MKRKNSTSLPRQAGYVKAGTVEKELKLNPKGARLDAGGTKGNEALDS